MTNRIPPSLNWLADKRSRLSGEIEKIDAEAAAYKARLREKASLLKTKKADLAAIDRALSLHEISVIPDQIAVIRAQNNPIEFSYGEFFKSIFSILESGPAPMSIPEIADAVAYIKGTALDDISILVLRNNIRNALKGMQRRGVVIRVSYAHGRQFSLWTAGNARRLGRFGRPPRQR